LGLGLTTFDLPGYFVGLAGFALTTVLAILVPLRRAISIDPVTALRRE
jgi:ABC-type antimicrobial peptide transport system permease subunit